MVVVDEMALFDFIVGHLDASTQFRKHHDLYVFVLDEDGVPFVVGLLVGDGLYHGVGVDYAA